MDLRTKAIRGVKWTTVGTIITSLFQFLQTLILARLLKPEDFGLMAIIMLVLGIGFRFLDLGLTTALIQKPKLSSGQYSTLYWASIFTGIMAFIVFNALTYTIVQFFDLDNTFIGYLKVSFLCFLLAPIGATYKALLIKRLKFGLINRINIGNAIGSFLVGIYLAIEGYGLWALLGAYIFGIIFESLMSLIWGWKYARLKAYFKLAEISGLIRFGFFDMAAGFVNYFSHNIDKLLIGKLIGPHALGLYTLAWNLVLFPLKQINPILMQVAFPVFTKIQFETQRLERYYYQIVLVLMAINIPLLLGLAVFSKPFLLLVFGPQWLDATITLSLLCIVGIIKCFADPGEKLLLAKGRADVVFYLNVIWSMGVVSLISLSLWLNPIIESVATGQICAGILVGGVWHYLVARIGGIKYGRLLKKMAGLLLFALPLLGIQVMFLCWIEEMTLLGFGIQLFIATIIYLAIIISFYRELLLLAEKFLKG